MNPSLPSASAMSPSSLLYGRRSALWAWPGGEDWPVREDGSRAGPAKGPAHTWTKDTLSLRSSSRRPIFVVPIPSKGSGGIAESFKQFLETHWGTRRGHWVGRGKPRVHFPGRLGQWYRSLRRRLASGVP